MPNAVEGILCVALLSSARAVEAPTPRDDRLVIELVAAEPEVVTPTGVAVDDAGRVWVIENQTHFRPDDYQGPAGDRIRIFDDFDADGRARRVRTFAEGFQNSMGLALMPGGDVYLVTRSRMFRFRDNDGDDRADEQHVVVDLKTEGNYPHNGLSGFARGPDGNLYFALGENLGVPYELVGSDGTTLSGGGEGGNIYRCRPDGSGLRRLATGFWNTFDLTFDAFGRLFAVDNDPDSRPPCRLLHIVEAGDYGYRFRYGRKGLHPFTSWNGELPGTLPMVAGTGEAPSGIVAYESDGLPDDYRGDLLVTSWGDHVIQRFRLQPRGASFSATAETMIAGDENFRPVGLAVAPDGSLLVTDWVDRSYPLHGKGRIWRIRSKAASEGTTLPPAPSDITSRETDALVELLASRRRELRFAAAAELARRGNGGFRRLREQLTSAADPRVRIHALWAQRFFADDDARKLAEIAVSDAAPEIRAAAVQVLADRFGDKAQERLVELATMDPSPFARHQALLGLGKDADLERVLKYLADEDPFLFAATIEVLGRSGRAELLMPGVEGRNPRMRLGVLLALRRTGTNEANSALEKFLKDPDPAVRRAAVQWVAEEKLVNYTSALRSAVSRPPVTRELLEAYLAGTELLAGGATPEYEQSRETYLAQLLADDSQPASLRALALRALPADHPSLDLARLTSFAESHEERLRIEALRVLGTRDEEPAQELLRHVASDPKNAPGLAAEAIAGLSHSAPTSPATRRVLVSLLEDQKLAKEALRALRGTAGEDEVRTALVELWNTAKGNGDAESSALEELAAEIALCFGNGSESSPRDKGGQADHATREVGEIRARTALHPGADVTPFAQGGDAAAGERLFFHPRGPKCFTCHRVHGRGGQAGPDLSTIARTLDRPKLAEAIVEPAKQIAPQYVTWTIATRNGRVLSGVILGEGTREITLADAEGKLTTIRERDIEARRPQNTSIMPDDLYKQMTPGEFRDLLAFLGTLK